MNNQGPLVSVIMPVYNAEKYLKEAIDSVINQSYGHWELLIIDDGSTDTSGEIIKQYNDKRIFLYTQANQGVSAARNRGLSTMRGNFFCFLDADDIYTRDSLLSRLEVFEKYDGDLTFVDGCVKVMDADLQSTIRMYRPAYIGNPFKPMLRMSESCYLGQSWMIRRFSNVSYAMQKGLTNGEDYLFLLQLARNGGEYNFTDETILIYRRHGASGSTNLDGLNSGYLEIHRHIRTWSELSWKDSLIYWLKSRKIMFLSYLIIDGSPFKAMRSLFQML